MMISLLTIAFALSSPALAHMQLNYPPPFRAANNPNTQGTPDNYLQYPFNCCGKTMETPCRGYHKLLGTPEGAPTATWAAGSQVGWNITGIGNHYGGSCQVGFSIDKGATFQVATTYEGNCPLRNGGDDATGQNFAFTVPADMPTGTAIFAWTWVNREQEFNMNCAAVTITSADGGDPGDANAPTASSAPTSAKSSAPQSSAAASKVSSAPAAQSTSQQLSDCACVCPSAGPGDNPSVYKGTGCSCTCRPPGQKKRFVESLVGNPIGNLVGNDLPARHPHRRHAHNHRSSQHPRAAVSVAYKSRPAMLISDTGNGCESPLTTAELKYPNPGPDVVMGDGEYPLQLPTGNCG